MSDLTRDISVLALGVCLVLLALTAFGQHLRARANVPSKAVEVFMTRVDSWWAMVVLFTLAVLAGTWAVILLCAVASFAALREFYTYTTRNRADHLSLALAFYVLLPAQFLFVAFDAARMFLVFIPIYVFLLLPVVAVLRGSTERFLSRVAEMQWGLMIAVFCLSHLPALTWLSPPDEAGRGVLMIAFLIMVVQVGDLADYFVGRRIGRRRIVAALSPKTWEGAGAGILAAGLLGAVLYWITPFSPLLAAALAMLSSLCGQAGNLVLRAIKRDRGLRDWSHLIPGQGGFLDQLDSVIFAAPAFFHLARALLLA